MTQDLRTTASVQADNEPTPCLCLMGGLDAGGLDSLMPGGVYALVPQSPPARYPLWANLLQSAVAAGQVCHVLLRTDPADFLDRLQRSGWLDARAAWQCDALRLYPMADGFSKLLFRRDVPSLTAELLHWGVTSGDFILVDAGDELLSLHDLFLATGQLVKLRAWARVEKVPMLLNFALAGAMSGQSSLTGLMDHFSGLARLHGDAEGPVLTLEYWQSLLGTVAERTVPLASVAGAFQLRPSQVDPESQGRGFRQQVAGGSHRREIGEASPIADETPYRRATDAHSDVVGHFTNDEVWARELQMLMGSAWQTLPDAAAILEAAQPLTVSHVVLRFAAHTQLVELARAIHALRTALASRIRIVVAEHRLSLRYANELMLMRLGADAIIRQDIPLHQWPGILRRLNAQTPRSFEGLDVEQALESVAASREKGYLPLPHFLSEVQSTVGKAHLLGVPFAMAVLGQPQDSVIPEAVQLVQMRRFGDLLTTDGHQIFVFFHACSLTMGPRVLAHAFEQVQGLDLVHVDWMASESDIQGLIQKLSAAQQAIEAQVVPEQMEVGPSNLGNEPETEVSVSLEPHAAELRLDDSPPSQVSSEVDADTGMSGVSEAAPADASEVAALQAPESFEQPATDSGIPPVDSDSSAESPVGQPQNGDICFPEESSADSPTEHSVATDGPTLTNSDSTSPPSSRPGKVLAKRVSEVVPHVPRSPANPAGFERRRSDQKESFVVERRVADLIRRLARPATEGSSRNSADSETRQPR